MLKELHDSKDSEAPKLQRPDIEKVPAPILDKTWLVLHNVNSLSTVVGQLPSIPKAEV